MGRTATWFPPFKQEQFPGTQISIHACRRPKDSASELRSMSHICYSMPPPPI